MQGDGAGTMERKRQIDREIRALESELLGHIDSELCRLGALLRHANRNWISAYDANVEVTNDVIDEFARRILDRIFMPGIVLRRGSIMEYVKTYYSTDYNTLALNYNQGDFDFILERAVLNAECLSSKINFLNRLKEAEVLHLSVPVEYICNPCNNVNLEVFKVTCMSWVKGWESICDKDEVCALNGKQRDVLGFYLNMRDWIERINEITDAAEAGEMLFSTYKTKMPRFEELREQLDSQS